MGYRQGIVLINELSTTITTPFVHHTPPLFALLMHSEIEQHPQDWREL